MPNKKVKYFELVLRSIPKEIIKVENLLKKINKYIDFDEIQFHNLLIATTEAVNNSIIHGNSRDPQKKVIVTFKVWKSSIEVKVEDEGKGIFPEDIPNPLSENNLLRENGRGIFLMRQFMDCVKFKTTKKGGEVIMKLKKRKSSKVI